MSGGAPGPESAALLFALDEDLQIKGHVLPGRMTESGRLPERYAGLQAIDQIDTAERDRRDVIAADAVLIIEGPASSAAATDNICEEARRLERPVFRFAPRETDSRNAVEWLRRELPPGGSLYVSGTAFADAFIKTYTFLRFFQEELRKFRGLHGPNTSQPHSEDHRGEFTEGLHLFRRRAM